MLSYLSMFFSSSSKPSPTFSKYSLFISITIIPLPVYAHRAQRAPFRMPTGRQRLHLTAKPLRHVPSSHAPQLFPFSSFGSPLSHPGSLGIKKASLTLVTSNNLQVCVANGYPGSPGFTPGTAFSRSPSAKTEYLQSKQSIRIFRVALIQFFHLIGHCA